MPKKHSTGDTLHALAKAGLSAIPIAGGPLVELFQFTIQPPVERRREQWMNEIGARLECLEKNSFDLTELKSNEEFVSAVMYATQAAIRTHNADKLEALANAVMNVAQGQCPDEATQQIFLNLVDDFTEIHLRILKTVQAPRAPTNLTMGSLEAVLTFNLPDLRGHQALCTHIWQDLYRNGLVNTDGLHSMMSESGLSAKRTTDFGDQFLRFISP